MKSIRSRVEEPTRAGSIPDRFFTPIMWLMATRLTVRSWAGRKLRDHFLDPPRGIPLGRARYKDIIAAGIASTRRGWPIQDRGIVESVPGLYFMGLLFLYSLSSALLGGVGRDAEHIVDHIASRRPLRREDLSSKRRPSDRTSKHRAPGVGARSAVQRL